MSTSDRRAGEDGRWRRERTDAEGLLENVVVKIADEVEVDVSTHAWKVFLGWVSSARETIVAGVRIPFLGLEALIACKETYREQDAADRIRLLDLKEGQ